MHTSGTHAEDHTQTFGNPTTSSAGEVLTFAKDIVHFMKCFFLTWSSNNVVVTTCASWWLVVYNEKVDDRKPGQTGSN